MKRWLLLACLLSILPRSALGADSSSRDWKLLGVAVRAQVEDQTVLGKDQPQRFREYDVMASIQLPWDGRSGPDWYWGGRLLASAGALHGGDTTALVVSAIPALALARHDGWLTLDLGVGLALLSRHRFPQQDFGGALQFALTFGVAVGVYRQLGVGYRFIHYSDGAAYGAHTIGADFHMLELTYRF